MIRRTSWSRTLCRAMVAGALCATGTGPALHAQDANPFKPDPRLAIRAIEGEAAWTPPSDADAVRKLGYLPLSGGYQFEKKDASGRRKAGVVISATVVLDRGLIEVFTCEAGGKEHETVLKIDGDLQALDMALLLSGLRRGRLPRRLGEADPEQGSRTVIFVQWMREGKAVTYRAEDLIIHLRRGTTMPRVGWTYVASWVEVPDPSSGGKKAHRVLAATGARSVATTFHDESSLLDNPLEERDDDALFAANYMVLPPPGTKVLMMLRAPTAEEAAAIAALEKELVK